MFLNMLQEELGLIPREVMDILITQHCDYISAITSLSAETCTTMLEAAGSIREILRYSASAEGITR
jgi:hypothetical protein